MRARAKTDSCEETRRAECNFRPLSRVLLAVGTTDSLCMTHALNKPGFASGESCITKETVVADLINTPGTTFS